MAVKKYKPTSPGRRFMSVNTFEEITATKPEKSLTETLTKNGGRNVNGRIISLFYVMQTVKRIIS